MCCCEVAAAKQELDPYSRCGSMILNIWLERESERMTQAEVQLRLSRRLANSRWSLACPIKVMRKDIEY